VDAFLALAVDAAAEAMGAQFVVGQLAGETRGGLGTEEFNVFADNPIVFLFQELLFGHQISD